MRRTALLAALVAQTGCSSGGAAPANQHQLQARLSLVESVCKLGSGMKLRAMSKNQATIDFPLGPLSEKSDAKLTCIAKEAGKIPGVTLGFLGNERYLDEGNSQ
jgi:hypothetical protein